jgi:hypothetical protein
MGACGPRPPTAQSASVSTAVDVPVSVTLLATDDGLPEVPGQLTYIIAALPGHGSLTDPGSGPITSVPYTLANNGNQVDYQPDAGYHATDSFQFMANDGGTPPEGGDSNLAVISITVGGPEWDPVAYDLDASTAVSTSVAVSLSGSDPNGDPLTYIIEGLPASGSLSDPQAGAITGVPYTLAGGGSTVTYEPPADQHLTDAFDFSVADATAGSNVATVTVTVGGPAWDPIAYDVSATTALGIPTGVLLAASDPNGDPLTYVIESLPASGFLSDPQAGAIDTVPYELVGGGSTVTYQPPCGMALVDDLTFSAHDLTAGSNVATASVTVTASGPRLVYSFGLDSDPGWSTEGEWAFGVPTGGGSHSGDPTSGYTGSNVYGYNLLGDYPDQMPQYFLTTSAIDCSVLSYTELRFQRWLGVELSPFDEACIEVSNDGSTWSPVWVLGGTSIDESSWSYQVYDISAVADGSPTVYVRWGIGPTDGSVTYPGWNIDDVEIWAVVPFVASDFNGDGQVNEGDFVLLEGCLSGPGGGLGTTCLCIDLDEDGDVDLGDFALFAEAYGS